MEFFQCVSLLSFIFAVTIFADPVPLEKHQLRRRNRPCNTNADCPIPNSNCYKGSICLCNDNFIAVNVNKTYFNCIPAAKGIGEPCVSDIQCQKPLGSFAICVARAAVGEGTCDCQQGAHYKRGLCYRTSRIGERCIVQNQCLIKSKDVNAYCSEGACICAPGYHPIDNGTDCFPSSELGGPCISDESCMATNTICLGRCACKPGFILNYEKNKCLQKAEKLDDFCSQDVQCSSVVPRSTCHPLRKRCTCEERWTREKNGQCLPIIRLDDPCKEKHECMVESGNGTNVDCVEGICKCAADHTRVKMDCIHMKSLTAGYGGTGSSLLPSSFWMFLIAILFLLK